MAAAPDDLCTLADLKAWLPNQGNNDDVTLQALITNGSAQVLEYINRSHILSTVLGTLNESYDGNDSDRLLPRSFPVISVSSVVVDGNAVPQAPQPWLPGFLWDGRRVLLRGYIFTRGVQNVQITYTAGYLSVPLDLKQAAIEAFALAYRQRTHIGEKSSSMGGQVTLQISAGADTRYAYIQEYGGYAGRKPPFKKPNGQRPYIPPRPYLRPALQDLQDLLPGLVEQAIENASISS